MQPDRASPEAKVARAADPWGMQRGSGRDWKREWITVIWLAGWAYLLWSLHRPWWLLGNWIDPCLLWAERAALYFTPPIGFIFGEWRRCRQAGFGGGRRRLIPPALLALTLLLVSRRVGGAELVGVATTAICGFTAGGLTASWRLLLRDAFPDPPRIPPSTRARPRQVRTRW